MILWEDIAASLDIEPTNEAQSPAAAASPSPHPRGDENRSVKASAPGRGTFFDEHIDVRDPEGGQLVERLIEAFDTVRPKKRKRHRELLKLRLRKIAANALRGYFYRDPASILYYSASSSAAYDDKPSWMKNGALRKAVDALADAGLVRKIPGKKMPRNSATRSWTSSFWATDELVCMAMECGVTAQSIERQMPSDALVQLYAPKPKTEFAWTRMDLIRPAKGRRILFNPTAETEGWTASLAAINSSYRQTNIALGLSPAELALWLIEWNASRDREGGQYRLPETFSTDLYRVFNDGNTADPKFDKGGRMFGGWWMQIPEELRRAITIDGQPTVELDYANCHPRMLYAERGLDCAGELYELPEITAFEVQSGLEPGTYRPCIKWLTQVLINGKRRPQEKERPDDIDLPPGFTVKEIAAFIEARHQPIADAFKTGAGLRLMWLESQIALEIVSTATAEGWTVLPVHDSFITTTDQQGRLKSMMIESYLRQFGIEPIIH